jgi:hypothetical protein|tara:strand:- start:52 stop:189 length:138 start_codon:yes stop_codon:yes gene_type:complete
LIIDSERDRVKVSFRVVRVLTDCVAAGFAASAWKQAVQRSKRSMA